MKTPELYPLIPDDAFLLVPEISDVCRVKQRMIFEGGIQISESESQKLADFGKYLNKNKIVLDPYWTQPNRLRFLQSCDYNFQKTTNDMRIHLQWINSAFPLPLTAQIEGALKEGIIYFCGRDHKYRPIIVFDVKKTLDKELPPDNIVEIYTYYLDFVVRLMLVEGRVQNWVLIVDLNGSGVFSTIGMLQKVLAAMSSRLRCRMHSCHLVRCPGAFSFIWAIVKKFLDEVAIEKISFTSKNKPENLLARSNHSQIQKKFSGTLDNIVEFWPVTIRSTDYSLPSVPLTLLTLGQYQRMYDAEQLVNQKINKKLIKVVQPIPNSNPIAVPVAQRKTQGQSFASSQKSHPTLYQIHSAVIHKENNHTQPCKPTSQSVYPLQHPYPSAWDGNNEILVSSEGAINSITHFVCNPKKPIDFSSYAQ